MEILAATERLTALAHETRLEVFRRLIQAGPEGLAAGDIAAAVEVAKPTLSFHLSHLERAGLVASRRRGRSILYSADYEAIAELVGFLYQNCCGKGSSCLPARSTR